MSLYDLPEAGILRVAFQMVGIVPLGQAPTNDQLAGGYDALSLRITELQSRGIILTQITHYTQALTAGVAQYTAPSDTLDIDDKTPYVTNTSGNDLPLKTISRGMYDSLTTKSSQAQPAEMYIERTNPITFFLYPVPDGNWPTITYPRIATQANLATGATGTGLRSKYLRCLVVGTAADLAFNTGFLDKQAALSTEFEKAVELATNDDNQRGPLQFKVAARAGYRRGY